jgi:hypothetical protein
MPRRTLGGVAGALLVADEDVAHRLIVHQRVVDRHDGAAGQAEDVGDPEHVEGADDGLGSGHHRSSSSAGGWSRHGRGVERHSGTSGVRCV